ncbi:MAG TPA: CoA-binding protein [Candidatus Sulfotelmatobacter sp.]|nr:CoA-binding protein [Candidatus Sulfotelmatobacter sp.]
MGEQRVSLEVIEDFLAQKRIALVGISREPKDFSVMLFEELCRRGYDVIPVNPYVPEVLGRRCYRDVQEIQPPVDAALLMTSPAVTETVVVDCAEAGIRRVWMYRAGGKGGAVSAKAVEFCRDHGMQVVPGECPYMFLPAAGLHRIHTFFRKLTGHYPRHGAVAA